MVMAAACGKPMVPSGTVLIRYAPGPVLTALCLSLCYACALFQRLAFQSVGPLLGTELGLSSAALADLGASFFWAYLLLMIPSGILVDMYGPRSMAIVGALLSSVGCALFAAAHGLPGLVVARVTISAGGAFAFVCMMRYIGTTFSKRKATMSGRGILIGNLGAISAGMPLALVLTRLHWREVWSLLALGWLMLALALHAGLARDPAGRLGSAAPAVLMTELRSIFGAASTYLGIVLIAGLAGTYWAFANFVGARVLSFSHLSSVQAGLAISALVCGYAIGAAAWGWLGDRFRRDGLVMVACVWTASAWQTFSALGSVSSVFATLVLFAAGFGSGAFGLVYLILAEKHPARQSGLVIASVNCGIPLGAALFQATAGRLEHVNVLAPILAGSLLAVFAAAALFTNGSGASRRTLDESG